MINNISVAMPQVGISQADMIIELMEEGSITRMMAFFMDPSGLDKIGSIRSARAYNVETALGYDGILVHAGGSTEAQGMIYDYGLADVDAVAGKYYGEAFYRDYSRTTYGIEHGLFADGSECMASAVQLGYRTEHYEDFDNTYGLIFNENAADQCSESAKSITVYYAGGKTTSFEYDEATDMYTAYQYGDEYNDNWETAVPFRNVIMIYASTWLQSDGVHLTIELDYGSGYYFTGGKAVPIHWYKDGAWDCFHFELEDGTPLELAPGKTFIAVNQTDSYYGSVEFE
jgi:hypothetical protein